jgi:hypothetical protein
MKIWNRYPGNLDTALTTAPTELNDWRVSWLPTANGGFGNL